MGKRDSKELIQRTRDYLLNAGYNDHEAQQDALWLIQALTQQSHAQLFINESVEWSSEQESTLHQWLKQLTDEKKPLQYILGSVPFMELTILVEPPILIPRPETEEIVIWLVKRLKQSKKHDLKILDLCCGSGCITLALAHALPQATVIGSDINEQAILLAEKNKAHNKIENVSFIQSNLFEAFNTAQPFDIIISNPPYLSEQAYTQVTDRIRLWEDKRALVAEHEGMALYEKIILQAPRYLNKHSDLTIPQLVLEIGFEQTKIEQLLTDAGFSQVNVHHDTAGLRRWVEGSI